MSFSAYMMILVIFMDLCEDDLDHVDLGDNDLHVYDHEAILDNYDLVYDSKDDIYDDYYDLENMILWITLNTILMMMMLIFKLIRMMILVIIFVKILISMTILMRMMLLQLLYWPEEESPRMKGTPPATY